MSSEKKNRKREREKVNRKKEAERSEALGVMSKKRRYSYSFLLLCFSLLMMPGAIFAQTETELISGGPPGGIITDRPDQTESSSTIPPGYVQVETGYLFVQDRVDGVKTRTHTGPFTLFRIGATNNLELRLGLEGVTVQKNSPGKNTTAWGDGEAGFKLHLLEESGLVPKTALLAGTSIPMGGANFSSERFDPFIIGLFSHTLTDRIEVAYNLGVVWNSAAEEGKRRDSFPGFKYTVASGVGLTDSWGMFFEFFGELPKDRLAQHSFDAGVTYSINDSIQLDLEVGLGLNRAAEDVFIGTGIVFRLPN